MYILFVQTSLPGSGWWFALTDDNLQLTRTFQRSAHACVRLICTLCQFYVCLLCLLKRIKIDLFRGITVTGPEYKQHTFQILFVKSLKEHVLL